MPTLPKTWFPARTLTQAIEVAKVVAKAASADNAPYQPNSAIAVWASTQPLQGYVESAVAFGLIHHSNGSTSLTALGRDILDSNTRN